MTLQPVSTETAEATSVRWGSPQLQFVLGWGAGVAAHAFSVYRNRNKRVTAAERSKMDPH